MHTHTHKQEDPQDGEMLWTWDVDNCGPSVRVQCLGMQVQLREDEQDHEEAAVWETYQGETDDWDPLPQDVQVCICVCVCMCL
jgi:hypothetical protein